MPDGRLGLKVQEQLKFIEGILKNKGYKFTEPLKDILCIILSRRSIHFGVKDIYKAVKEVNKHIGLATVYRTLNKLLDTGVISKVSNVKERRGVYELKIFSKKCHHIHLVCKNCGSLQEYASLKDIQKLMDEIREKYGFVVVKYDIILEGLCKNCSDKCNYIQNPVHL